MTTLPTFPTALDIAVGLDDVLEAGDLDAQVQRAWIAAQELRLLYREPDRVHAERRLLRWLTDIADHEIPELLRLARTLDSWRDENARLLDTNGVFQRAHRSGKRADQEDQTRRPRLPQFHHLPAALVTALRHHLAHSGYHPDQRAPTTLNCAEPVLRPCRCRGEQMDHRRSLAPFTKALGRRSEWSAERISARQRCLGARDRAGPPDLHEQHCLHLECRRRGAACR
jgi:hypothetical protein